MHLTALLLSVLTTIHAATAMDIKHRDTSPTTDQTCNDVMCVASSTNETTVQYTLSYLSAGDPGWMALGFGTSMAGSPMVIVWSNEDNTITLSQREASGHSPPTVVAEPARVAWLSKDLSVASGSVRYTFTLNVDGTTAQNVIFASGPTNPGNSDGNTQIGIHDNIGKGSLNVAAPGGSQSSGNSSDSQPLLKDQKMIVAHGILCLLGFLFFLPAGSLWARWTRSVAPGFRWATVHWLIQFGITMPIVVSGVALGTAAVSEVQGEHLSSTHQKWGIAIFILYFAQNALGAVVHWLKPKHATRRPPQNYLHAVLGLFIIAASYYQVRTGYKEEWPKFTGLPELERGADIVFYIWIALIPILYVAGLAFLPRQFRREAQAQNEGEKTSVKT